MSHLVKDFLSKENIKENFFVLSFLYFSQNIIHIMSNVYGYLRDQCGPFDTHIDIVYDILCHKCHIK